MITIAIIKKQSLRLIISYLLNVTLTTIIYSQFGYSSQDTLIVFIVGMLLCSFWIVILLNFYKRIATNIQSILDNGFDKLILKNNKYSFLLFWSLSASGYVAISIAMLSITPTLIFLGVVTSFISISYIYLSLPILKVYSSVNLDSGIGSSSDETILNPINNALLSGNKKEINEKQSIFYGDTFNFSENFVDSNSPYPTSGDDHIINPATGLEMVGGIGGLDAIGNPYGIDTSDNHYHNDDSNIHYDHYDYNRD